MHIKGVSLASGQAAIRYQNRDDIAIIVLPNEAVVSAVFTQNKFCAAPVIIAKQHLLTGHPKALLINAGNANAGTGKQGEADCLSCCHALAQHLHCETEDILPFGTGVIGERLPVAKIKAVLGDIVKNLAPHHWELASKAIMTTDSKHKIATRSVQIGAETISIVGIAKGVGMIHPNMATLLAYVTCDAKLNKIALDAMLSIAVEKSFNCITVDGDTSTNDACVLIANGEKPISDKVKFQSALTALCIDLAKQCIADGEGATKLVRIEVTNGKHLAECKTVAYTIAHSPLVKTALFAADPNWGRILAAIGRADIDNLDVNSVSLALDDVVLIQSGQPNDNYQEKQAQAVMNKTEYSIHVDLQRGDAKAQIWTCDLSYDYVKINAEYRS